MTNRLVKSIFRKKNTAQVDEKSTDSLKEGINKRQDITAKANLKSGEIIRKGGGVKASSRQKRLKIWAGIPSCHQKIIRP